MSNDREYYSKVRQKNNALTYSAGKLCLSASQPLKVLVFGLGLNGGGVGSARFLAAKGPK